jgi:hypothetical protein
MLLVIACCAAVTAYAFYRGIDHAQREHGWDMEDEL